MKPLTVLPVLVLLVAAACGTADPADTPPTTTAPTTTQSATDAVATDPVTDDTTAVELLPDLGPAPELHEIDGWLQADIESLDDLRGNVVVVQFWTFGCHNCKATLDNLGALYAEYQGDEFEIVGIHSPEFDYEKDPEAIAAAADKLGVTWPIALDTAKRTFFHWQNSPAYWPRTYVLDRDGTIRFDHIGEGAYEELNEAVATLLG